MGTLCEDQQLLTHCLPKPAANELFGSVWAAEPGLCVAVELDHSPSHGQLGHRRGFTNHMALDLSLYGHYMS